MQTRWTQDQAGLWYLEIISPSYQAVNELSDEHKKLGRKTWINPYGAHDNTWMLTVQMPRQAAVAC